MFELKVTTSFAAAHQLAMVGEKCENLHGHNWKVEVCITGENLDPAGVLMDFGILKKHVREILESLDHKFLNEIEAFKNDRQPSSENIACYIAAALRDRLTTDSIRVSRVTAWESENAAASFIPAIEH